MQNRCAVSVDAGYSSAQGSAALTGSSQPRDRCILDVDACNRPIDRISGGVDYRTTFLRTYWYDGLRDGREAPEQARIAESAFMKARYGIINAYDQPKGVDTLIVTDLVELARLGTILNAIVMSGDEDLRVGVEIAERYGVRIHLLGIVADGKSKSQSHLLSREADSTFEWTKDDVSTFLSVVPIRDAERVLPSRTPPECATAVTDLHDVVETFAETVPGPDQPTLIAE